MAGKYSDFKKNSLESVVRGTRCSDGLTASTQVGITRQFRTWKGQNYSTGEITDNERKDKLEQLPVGPADQRTSVWSFSLLNKPQVRPT